MGHIAKESTQAGMNDLSAIILQLGRCTQRKGILMIRTRFVQSTLLGFLVGTMLMAGQGRAQGQRPPKPAADGATAEEARKRMVDEEIVAAGVKNPRVIAAMRATPRHEFVPLSLWPNAYYDMALPIGEGQTISPPFIVAYMTEAIDPQPTDKVLEIGTGSGYQAAVLSGLVQDVYSIEIVESLGSARPRPSSG